MLLTVDCVTKTYSNNKERLVALNDCTINVSSGEFVCILGPSGCGKSTLLNMIAGLDCPTEGTIVLNGKKVSAPGPDRAVMFQEPALLPWLRVADNIEFGMKMAGYAKHERNARSASLLELMNMSDFADACVHELSGGMKQRVSLARTFAVDSELLLLDEPFSALDNHTRHVIQEELIAVWAKTGKTILFVTHNPEEAYLLADRVLVMSNRPGRVCSESIIDEPRVRDISSAAGQKFMTDIKHILRDEVERFAHQAS